MAVTIEVSVDGFVPVVNIEQIVGQAMRAAAPQMARVLARATQRRAPRRSGRLLRSLEVHVAAASASAIALELTGIFYLAPVEERLRFFEQAVADSEAELGRIMRESLAEALALAGR